MSLGLPTEAHMMGSERVRSSFTRTGGYAGIAITNTIDTATLSIDRANQLRQLIDTTDFFRLPPAITSRPPHPDRFQYTLTVEKDGQYHTVVVNEEAVPEALKPLITWLMDTAQ